jgi:hypothetical protein
MPRYSQRIEMVADLAVLHASDTGSRSGHPDACLTDSDPRIVQRPTTE